MQLKNTEARGHDSCCDTGSCSHGHHHNHDAADDTVELGRVARTRQWLALKAAENTPILGNFVEVQLGCTCSAGCAKCAGGAIVIPAWEAVKGWFAGRRAPQEQASEALAAEPVTAQVAAAASALPPEMAADMHMVGAGSLSELVVTHPGISGREP